MALSTAMERLDKLTVSVIAVRPDMKISRSSIGSCAGGRRHRGVSDKRVVLLAVISVLFKIGKSQAFLNAMRERYKKIQNKYIFFFYS